MVEKADAAHDAAHEATDVPAERAELVEERVETVTVRRAPRVTVFLLLGAALGVVVALILTFGFGIDDGTGMEASPLSPVSYSKGQVFGFLVLACGAAGVALGGIVAVILDRTVGRRSRRIQVEKESVTSVD